MSGSSGQVRDVAGARVVMLPADLDQRLADRLRPALLEAAESGRDLVIDMRDAATIDPAGLGLLVRAHRAARQHGATLCLVAPSRFVLTVLHTMRLDGVFPIFADLQAALAMPERSAASA
ncbi:STAS domain-containing protein [Actinoplanes sp. CA-252034]|uniref:STAS domain-containing protein n=1 Tax=Actinoplanes sp. CA-252034 TaxID=3239906 RepID=UPI003D95129C